MPVPLQISSDTSVVDDSLPFIHTILLLLPLPRT
jgi:hypothetical protein